MNKPITVVVKDAEQTVFEGEIDRISSFNEVGRFDIFPMHANFISIIYKELLLFKNHQKVKEMKIEQAILKVKKDSVQIFLGVETLMVDEENIVKEEEKESAKKAQT